MPGAATSVELDLVRQLKAFLNASDDMGFQEFCASLLDTEFSPEPTWPWVFQKVYIHACLRRRVAVAEWLRGIATANPTLVGLGWRQTVAYGKALLSQN